ncbi:MAG: phosphodiester glycosidase family protein [Chthonomonadales bacterium]
MTDKPYEPNSEIKKPVPRRRRRIVLSVLATLVVLPLAAWYWSNHRNQPPPFKKKLFQGVTYIRDVRTSPCRNVIHVLLIRLDTPGLKFLVTKGDPKKLQPLTGMVTSDFLVQNKLRAAINGDFFFPWHSRSPLDYYPHVGDPVELEGIAASEGLVYSSGNKKETYPCLFISKDNQVDFSGFPDGLYNVISGDHLFLTNGDFGTSPAEYHHTRQPRTAVALTADKKTMIWIVVDGRQPNYSEGMTMAELAEVVVRYGGTDALNLDGGGSSEMVAESANHSAEILNCPIDCHIPGRERPVANHLGLFAPAAH